VIEGPEAAALLLLALPALLAIGARWSGQYPVLVPQWDPGAEQRAASLLRDLLSDAEREELARVGCLTVPSPSIPSRVYRVPAGAGHVRVYEAGEHVMSICVQPTGPLPSGDLVAMHKLMIEGDEGEYLRRTRVHWSRG